MSTLRRKWNADEGKYVYYRMGRPTGQSDPGNVRSKFQHTCIICKRQATGMLEYSPYDGCERRLYWIDPKCLMKITK